MPRILIVKYFKRFFLILVAVPILALFALPAANGNIESGVTPLSLDIIHEIGIDFSRFVKQGDYYYATDQNNLYIIDAQDPTHPEVVGTLSLPIGDDFEVSGDYLYAETGIRTVTIVDISTPENPFVITSYSNFEAEFGVLPAILDIAATEQTLFVSLDYFVDRCPEGGKVAILDVTDPADPVRVGEISLYSGGSSEVEARDGRLYHLIYQVMRIYDVPAPGIIEHIETIGLYEGVHHYGGSIILDDDLALLSYFEVGFPCEDPYGMPGWFVVDVSDPYNENPSFLVYQENILKVPTTHEDGYLFTVSYSGMELFALPDINQPLLEDENVHKSSMNFKDGILTYLPESGTNQDAFLNYFSTARLFVASATVSPTLTSTLTYTDTNGPTEVLLPAGAVENPAEVSILPLPAPDNPPEDLWLKQAFDIRGHFPAQQQTLYAFQQPLTATLPFTADPAAYPLGWQFLYWNETKWEDPAETCAGTTPAAEPIAKGDMLQVSFCLPGKYGLFVPFYDVSLPVIHR